jgi:hypothetical protein
MNLKQTTGKKLSQQMRAVCTILAADPDLSRIAGRHVDPDNDRIDWDAIFKYPWGSGHKAVLGWAYALWRDEGLAKINLFDGALNLDYPLLNAILEALVIRWNLQKKSIEFPAQQTTIQEGAL